jgi:hypothetical protein
MVIVINVYKLCRYTSYWCCELSEEEKVKGEGEQVKPSPSPEATGVEELEKLIREAQEPPYVSKDLRENKLCIQWGKRKVKCVQYDPKLEEHLKPIAEEVRAAMKGKPSSGTSITSTSDIGIWMTSIRGKRPLVEHLVEELAWAQKSFLKVGVYATLAMLMASGVPPDKIEEHVYKFKSDPDALTSFVLNKLENFVVAASSQQDLLKCRNDVAERDAVIAYIESEYESLYNSCQQLAGEVSKIKRRYRMLEDMFRMALMFMPRDKLKIFTDVVTAMVLEHQEKSPAQGGVS